MSAVTFDVNGSSVRADRSARRLSDMLRDELGLTATKVGCDAGDCGACTVLLDGEPVSACMTPVGRLAGRRVETLEGLHASGECRGLQTAFLTHGAAQCGICTPGMLVSAAALLRVTPAPTEQQVMDGLGGVLCRCTGYRKIIAAVMNVGAAEIVEGPPPVGKAVGQRVQRVDGLRKVDGTDVFGSDETPRGSARDQDRALALPSGPFRARRPGRVRRRIAGGRRGHDRVRHPRPQRVRRDPGDRRSAGVRRTRPGGALPG